MSYRNALTTLWRDVVKTSIIAPSHLTHFTWAHRVLIGDAVNMAEINEHTSALRGDVKRSVHRIRQLPSPRICQADEDLLAVGGDAPGGQTPARLRGVGMHAEV